MGTQLQEVYDAFFIKVPNTDFSGQQQLVYQLFKASLSHCYKTVSESLQYTITPVNTYDGVFYDILGQDTIELISLYMKRELYRRLLDKYSDIKQHVGTQAFNKLPNMIEQSKEARQIYDSLNDEIDKFKQEFYEYSN